LPGKTGRLRDAWCRSARVLAVRGVGLPGHANGVGVAGVARYQHRPDFLALLEAP